MQRRAVSAAAALVAESVFVAWDLQQRALSWWAMTGRGGVNMRRTVPVPADEALRMIRSASSKGVHQ